MLCSRLNIIQGRVPESGNRLITFDTLRVPLICVFFQHISLNKDTKITYTHDNEKRTNNPSVGIADPIPAKPKKKTYSASLIDGERLNDFDKPVPPPPNSPSMTRMKLQDWNGI